jgi:anaerobic magnesium-protoporphyrin IX monomethyl ester cyclase
MRIGLVYPNKGKKEKAFHVGLGSIAAYARIHHNDLNFTILDTRISSSKEEDDFFNTSFDLIGITAMAGIFAQVLQVAERVKEKSPSTIICVGGPYVSTLGLEILDFKPIDLAVYGEGEECFNQIIHHIKSPLNLREINGLIFRNEKGVAVQNLPSPSIRNIDELPMPAYDLFEMDAYPIHRIVTSRGCPYKCSFCSSAVVWEFKWKKRTAKSLVDEIEHLIETYGRKTFFFNDDSFNMDLKRADEICNELINRKLNILWSTPLRADRINDELASKMKKAGCYNVGIGIESANNELLLRMDKQTSIENITAGIKTFRKAGIEVLGQFLIGNIGETWETFLETLDYAKKSELDFVLFYSILPYKGTKQWEYVENEGRFLHHTMHEFQSINPRIIFETDQFSYEDRLKAIQLTQKEGFYVDDNRMSYLFDFGRSAAKYFQRVLPAKSGNWLFLNMKSFYRNWLRNTVIKQ